MLNKNTEETSADSNDSNAASINMEVLQAGDPGPVTDPGVLTEADEGSNTLNRSGRSDPSKWKRNVAKCMHSECQPYSTKKVISQQKQQRMLTVHHENSNSWNTSEEDRSNVCKTY